MDYERTNSLDKNIGTSYLNSIIFTKANNELFNDLINICVNNILNKQNEFDILTLLEIPEPINAPEED